MLSTAAARQPRGARRGPRAGPVWVAAAAPGASRGALPTALLALPAARPTAGGRAGGGARYEPVARLVGSSASVAELVRLSWCIGHRFVSFVMAHEAIYSMNYKFQLALSILASKN